MTDFFLSRCRLSSVTLSFTYIAVLLISVIPFSAKACFYVRVSSAEIGIVDFRQTSLEEHNKLLEEAKLIR